MIVHLVIMLFAERLALVLVTLNAERCRPIRCCYCAPDAGGRFPKPCRVTWMPLESSGRASKTSSGKEALTQ